MKPEQQTNEAAEKPASEEWLETVRRQVASLHFGAVEVVVHDSKVVQIEKKERIRFDLSKETR